MAKYAPKRSVKKSVKRIYKKAPRKASRSLTMAIKKVIHQQLENKVYTDYGVNQSIACASGNVPGYKNLIPILNQGTTSSNRIGNEIRVVNGYIRGHVNLLPFDSTSNILPLPCYVKMWVCSNRKINTQTLSNTAISTNFFDAGGTQTGFQGNMLDIDFSPNKDDWIIYSTKTVRLGVGYATGSTVATSSYFDNSPMSVPFQFNFGKKIGKVTYDETSVGATNKNMFLVFQVVAANGANTAAQIPAEFHYTSRVEYEDA